MMLTRKILSEKLEEFYKKAASDKKTLDVGSRSGRHAKFFSNVTTIDIDKAAGPDIVADAHKLPFEDNSFEIVLCREVLEHVERPEVVINELKRVLVPGGKLYLSTRFLFPIHEAPQDRWRFTNYVLEELFSSWSSSQVTAETGPMTAIACLLQRLAWQSKFKYLDKAIKVFILFLAFIFSKLDWIVKMQFGDVSKKSEVETAFTTGYYVTAVK